MSRRALVIALGAGAVLSPLNSTMLAAAMPRIEHDFSVTPGLAAAWLVGGYLLVSVVALAPIGRLADLIGHRVVFASGLALTTLGALCAILAPDFAVLAIGRLLMGVGGSCIVPTAMAMLRLAVPPESAARALGAFGSLMASSAAVGPFLGGAIADRWGWHAVFIASAPLLATAALLSPAMRSLAAPPTKRPRFDLLGSALLGCGLSLLVAAAKAPWPWNAPCAISGALALALFVAHERRDPSPVLDLGLFHAAPFVGGAAVVALHNLGMYSLLYALPHLLGERCPDLVKGEVLAAMTVAMVVGGPVGGRLSGAFGARAVTAMSSALAAVGALALAWTLPAPIGVAGCLAICGLGIGLSTGPSQASALAATPRERSGMASAALSTARYLGGLAGGTILAATLPKSGVPSDALAFVAPYAGALLLAALVARALPGKAQPLGAAASAART